MKTCSILLAIVASAVGLSSCISTKYQMARKDTPPVVLLNLAAERSPVEIALNTVIIYKGPGSWKRAAFWDEYVVSVHNQGDQPLTISEPALVDFAGASLAPGVDPWALEKQSQTLEKGYRRAGVAFARNVVPGALILGAGAGAIASTSLLSAAAATAATATVIALPVYYIVVMSVNHSNKKAVMAEFSRRRLALPLTLAPREIRTGSLFFPMVPNPQSLSVKWATGTANGELALSLESLHGLHIVSPAPKESRKSP